MIEKTKNPVNVAAMIISWSAFYIISKWSVDLLGSAYLSGFLMRISTFFVLTIFLLAKREFSLLFKAGKVTFILLAIGIIGFSIDFFANTGFRFSNVSTGTILLKTDVLMVNVISALFLKEKLHFSDHVASLIMLVGVALTLGVKISDISINPYDVMFVLSAVGLTTNAFIIKYMQERFGIKGEVIAYYNNLVTFMVFGAITFLSGDFAIVKNAEFDFVTALLFFVGGLGEALNCIFYYKNLTAYPVWQIKLYLLFVPIISAFFGIFVFGETIDAGKAIGILLVLLGAVLIVLRDKITTKKCN